MCFCALVLACPRSSTTGAPGERVASTTNRNFVGRQGTGVRTHLVGPEMAAAAALTGTLTDIRKLAR